MNTLDYEVDSMGGLMPQILALTAPPGTRENNRQPLQQQISTNASSSQSSPNGNGQNKVGEAGLAAHPYFRRPGRGHNHDCCDACSEGGDLICCDLCPASFHLTCHDPPLDEDEIPTGEWACHQCRMGYTSLWQKEEEKPSGANGKALKGSKVSKKKEETKQKEENDHKVYTGGRELHISDSPLYTLIKAAAVINPTQFTLPYEMTVPANFPGEPKETLYKRNGSKRGPTKKKPYELDNGLVPLPAKLCFQCNKSCRMGPLIPCDFCPLFYHLDCLDPPLTTPPMGRWMCPNHPEHHMDTTLLTSHSLTERVKLWDRFSTPLDQDSVKLCFLQRCHRLNPPFRYKVKKALRSRLRVPSAIKAHYQDPPDLLPHLSPSQYIPFPPPFDHCPPSPSAPSPTPFSTTRNISLPPDPASVDSMAATTQDESPPDIKEEHQMEVDASTDATAEDRTKHVGETNAEAASDPFTDSTKPSQEERHQWLVSVLSLQSSIIRHMATGDTVPSKRSEAKVDSCNGLPHSDQSPLTPLLDSRPTYLNGDLVYHESKSHKMCLDGMNNHINDSGPLSHAHSSISSSGNKRSTHKTQKNKLSSISSSKSRQKRNTPTEILTDTLSNLGVSLREKLEENHGLTLSSLEQSVVEVLAYERLKDILEPPKSSVVFSTPPLAARALLCPLVPDFRLKDFSPKQKYSSTPVPMTFRILNIGKGSHNHVNLELYGHCNYVSHHHACILFDETTGHYELLNYSEFDTKVDCVTYNCDYSEKTISQAVPPPFLQHVKAIIAKRREEQSGRMTTTTTTPPAMNSRPGEKFTRCECRRENEASSSKVSKGSGWEGTAVLHHGSYIRFGCLKFVFSVVEEASKGDWARDTTITYEKFFKKNEEEREEKKEERVEDNESNDKKEDQNTKS